MADEYSNSDLKSIVPKVNRKAPTLTEVQKSGKVPAGYRLSFTKRGIPLLSNDGGDRIDSGDDEDAANEYSAHNISFFINLEEVEKRFGIGIRLYYNFVIFLMISNLILALLACVHWIYYLAHHRDHSGWRLYDLFVGAYPHSMRTLWMTMNIISIVCWFSFGPMYYFYVAKVLRQKLIEDHDNPFLFNGNGLDLITGNRHFSSRQRFSRRLGSIVIFLSCLAASFGLTFVVQWSIAQNDADGTAVIFAKSIGATLLVSGINFGFAFLGRFLTTFERHKTWSQLRKYEGVKLITFKITNVLAFYVASFTANSSNEHRCYMEDSGLKFLTLILTDLVFFNLMELFFPIFKTKLITCVKNCRNVGGMSSEKPEFDIAQEYLELFYRQFVIYIGTMVFPMMAFLGLLANVIEYPVDKYRMLRLCQKPQRLDHSLNKFLVFWMMTIPLIALLCFPQGPIWVMGLDRTAFSGDHRGYWCCDLLNGHAPYSNFTCNHFGFNVSKVHL